MSQKYDNKYDNNMKGGLWDNKEKKTQEVKIDKQRTSKVSKASSKKTVWMWDVWE